MKADNAKKRNIVTVRLTDTKKAKLDKLSKTFDMSYSWIINRLISVATVEQIREIDGDIER
jgi:predicted transcriptional regulator